MGNYFKLSGMEKKYKILTKSEIKVEKFPGPKETEYTTYPMIQHNLVRSGSSYAKSCAYCRMVGRRQPSGRIAQTYYMCAECDLPLCSGKRNCFNLYHNLYSNDNAQDVELKTFPLS